MLTKAQLKQFENLPEAHKKYFKQQIRKFLKMHGGGPVCSKEKEAPKPPSRSNNYTESEGNLSRLTTAQPSRRGSTAQPTNNVDEIDASNVVVVPSVFSRKLRLLPLIEKTDMGYRIKNAPVASNWDDQDALARHVGFDDAREMDDMYTRFGSGKRKAPKRK